jgi:hypothetical protein
VRHGRLGSSRSRLRRGSSLGRHGRRIAHRAARLDDARGPLHDDERARGLALTAATALGTAATRAAILVTSRASRPLPLGTALLARSGGRGTTGLALGLRTRIALATSAIRATPAPVITPITPTTALALTCAARGDTEHHIAEGGLWLLRTAKPTRSRTALLVAHCRDLPEGIAAQGPGEPGS